MAVKVREKPKGSGVFWIFIHHQGRRKSKKIGTDYDIAHQVAEKIKAKLVLNELSVEKINRKCPTFKEYGDMWLSLPTERKQSTQDNYKRYLRDYAYPHIGNMRLDRITRKDFKLMFDKIAAAGVKPSSCNTIRIPVNGVMEHAVDSELVEVNHLKAIKSGRGRFKSRIDPLTERQATRLLDEMAGYKNGLFYPPLLCLLRTGIRIGELQALTWKDLDFKGRLIDINKTWWRGVVTTTKTHKVRRVDMSKQLCEVLRELKQNQWKRYAGKDVPEWVFAGPRGNVLCLFVFRNALNACLDSAGLRHITIHGLRHTYATIRLLKGHNIGDVSYQLGHSSIETTYDTYTHWIPGKFKSEVDELDTAHPGAPQAHPGKRAAL